MEKEFIPYEQALALKELGFDETCLAFYNKESKLIITGISKVRYSPKLWTPTFSQAFKWIREKYNYNASIYPLTGKFSSQVYDIFRGCYITKIDLYETYEEAEIECLKKLIKIVKDAKK